MELLSLFSASSASLPVNSWPRSTSAQTSFSARIEPTIHNFR